jgi:TruB family pseudouridylate synthase (N terminal domain)
MNQRESARIAVVYTKRGSQRNTTTTSTKKRPIILVFIIEVTMLLLSLSKNASAFTAKYVIKQNQCRNRLNSRGNICIRSYTQRQRPALDATSDVEEGPPALLVEGLFVVDKPLEWTSQDVVSYIRGMYERDARIRGVKLGKVGSRKNKGATVIRCGHGGTLDPLASGILVIGLGSGTKLLQWYARTADRLFTSYFPVEIYTHVYFPGCRPYQLLERK